MALNDDQTAELAKLRAAYTALTTGTQATLIQQGPSKTEFGKGDPAAVLARIETLEAIAKSPHGRSRGAIGFRVGNRGCW